MKENRRDTPAGGGDQVPGVVMGIRQRRLAKQLRDLRADTGQTAEQVIREMGWSAGKLSRYETGDFRRPNHGDIRDLAEYYGASAEQVAELVALARDIARKRSWSDLPYAAFIDAEAEAVGVETFESANVPGLLQTKAYADAINTATLPAASESQVRTRTAVRMERQRLLSGQRPIRLWALMDEAALWRGPGPEIMLPQLEHLVTMGRQPNITVQVIPRGVGFYPGLGHSFTILRFPGSEPDIVYVEGLPRDRYLDSPADTEGFTIAIDHLRATALSAPDSERYVERLADELRA